MSSRLILVRHGQTSHNVQRRIQGQIDIPMNALGLEQAEAVGRALAGCSSIVAVYSSPLTRARDTARRIAGHHGLEVSTDDRLMERGFGEWEGLTREDLVEKWPEEFEIWRKGLDVENVGIEPRMAVGARFDAACREFNARHPEGDVVIVAHGAAITHGIVTMMGLRTDEFRAIAGMDNCHRAILIPQAAPGDGAWVRLSSLNVSPDFSGA